MIDFDKYTDLQLLQHLASERAQFTQADTDAMLSIIDVLQRRGVYPAAMSREDVLKRVEGYGPSWHKFAGALECPHCKADLRSPEGPPFKREIVIKDRNDWYVDTVCPDCRKSVVQTTNFFLDKRREYVGKLRRNLAAIVDGQTAEGRCEECGEPVTAYFDDVELTWLTSDHRRPDVHELGDGRECPGGKAVIL